jgi:hypothetical protein
MKPLLIARGGAVQSTAVAPPQHRLYFFPEPLGHGSFRLALRAERRGALWWAVGGSG